MASEAHDRLRHGIRPLAVAALIALTGAAAITATSTREPLEAAVIEIEARAAYPDAAQTIGDYPTPVQANLVRYRDDPALALAARHALARYPQHAPAVLRHHGHAPTFQTVLRRHGAAVIPPIAYYRRHELALLEIRAAVVGLAQGSDTSAESDGWPTLNATERGRYAIRFIAATGHDFLGQFVIGPDDAVARVQSERWATATKRFLTGGVTRLERRLKGAGEPETSDYAWAAVDVLGPIAAFKLVRMGRGARLARASRAAARGSRTLRLAKVGAGAGLVGGIGYLAVHPHLLNSLAGELARWLGWPAWVVQAGLWLAVLLPMLVLARWLWLVLGRPATRALAWLLLRVAGPRPSPG